MKHTLLIGLAAVFFLNGCVQKPVRQDMSAFAAAAPRSLLVVPTINQSLDVDAPNYVLTTLPTPIANKGYYVFPVNTTKFVLEQEGLYDADRIHQMPTPQLANMFGADAVLYVRINRWDAQYAIIATTVTVDFDYRMVSKDGVEIWKQRKQMQWSPQNNNSSGSPIVDLIGMLVQAAIARAAPNYMPMTRQANQDVFVLGVNALPNGPYAQVKR